jgi:hypothetical protein
MEEILKKIVEVDNHTLDSLDTSFVNSYNFYHDISYFHGKAGKEHYRLLMYISSLFNKEILFDLGTNKCMSAAALSYKFSNYVRSYDIVQINISNPIIPYTEFILGDIREDKKLINSNFIFMDVDHDGKFENLFYDHLHFISWKGFLVLDDIHLNNPMKNFWNRISEDKYDLTEKGHWSGTGLVYFK